MEINGISGRRPTGPRSSSPQKQPRTEAAKDRVEISAQAQRAQRVRSLAQEVLSLPEVRDEQVNAARRLISSGELFSWQTARLTAREMLKALGQ